MDSQQMGFISKDTPRAFQAVAFDTTANQITATCTAAGTIAGFTQDVGVAGSPVAVKFDGITKAIIKTAAGISTGTNLAVAADGGLLAAVATNTVVARAMQTPVADGDIILVQAGPYTIY